MPLGCAVGNSVAQKLREMRESEVPLRWEYMSIIDPSTETFRKLGLDGWEAYAVTAVPKTENGTWRGVFIEAYFKRLVQHG